MKLNNKGFAISTIMYMILIMAVVLIALTLSLVTSRKLILDKQRKETINTIYNDAMTYRQALNILKNEAINYATTNNITDETIKISRFNTTIDRDILDVYDLSDKDLIIKYVDSQYFIYIDDLQL